MKTGQVRTLAGKAGRDVGELNGGVSGWYRAAQCTRGFSEMLLERALAVAADPRHHLAHRGAGSRLVELPVVCQELARRHERWSPSEW